MAMNPVVDRQEWIEARKRFLEEEKDFTRRRDALSARRRELPWVRIDTDYQFEGPEGHVSLDDLFGPRSQLLVYHFMFAPEWEKPCKSCSFWADGYNGVTAHLEQRDTRLVAISRAPREKLVARARTMGWTFPWYTGSREFNEEFGVSFDPDAVAAGRAEYNYRPTSTKMSGLPGLSAFVKRDGEVFHTYSCYARGLDILNPAYNLLDVTALGRQEEGLPMAMSWVRLRDEYPS